MLRKRYSTAWTFHHNTVRWPFNTLETDDDQWVEAPFEERPDLPLTLLPTPCALPGSLSRAITDRITCRSFASLSMSSEALSTLLKVSYGVQGDVSFGSRQHLERPVPSGGGLYPLELYIIAQRVDGIVAGTYHYMPLYHGLEQLRRGEYSSPFISQLFMNQPYLSHAAAIILFTAIAERSLHKYTDRGYRYILLECGHAAQNICLAAAAMNLGALPIGGFFDAYLAEVLGVDLERELLLYGLGIGPSAVSSTDRIARRNLNAFVSE